MNIIKPTFLIDEGICRQNIEMMSAKALRNKVVFRPHFKTHQSIEIGNWFRENGISKITVSSVKMAVCFFEGGWDDILIAFPVNILEINEINNLAKKIKLSLLVDSSEAVQFLNEHLSDKVDVYIKIDTGYHRAGISSSSTDKIIQLATQISVSPNLEFTGLLTHTGNTYSTSGKSQIVDIFNDADNKLSRLKILLQSKGFDPIISIGDTPSCSIVPSFRNADEIRPGNFVFNDIMQYYLGSCSIGDIAVRMACPVVSKNESRKEIIVYGGAIHLSKEFVIDHKGQKNYGLITDDPGNGFGNPIKECFVLSLSQEHGTVQLSKEYYNKINIGDMIGIIPVHSCLTANLNNSYFKIY